jgi:hypothetical protein
MNKTDLYTNWKNIAGNEIGDVNAVNCPDPTNCFMLVNHISTPVLYKSYDNGKSWNLIYSDNIKRHPLVRLGASPHPNYYFLTDADYQRIRKSTDGGYTFKEIVMEAGYSYLRTFAMYDTNYGFASNSNSYFSTTDGWETFKKYRYQGQITLYSPQFLDSNTVVMTLVSDQNPKGFVFVKYNLKEDRFDSLSFLGFDAGFDPGSRFLKRMYNIYFLNDKLGFGSGYLTTETNGDNYYDMIYRTTDGGLNWETILKEYKYPQIGLYNNIAFADEMNGVAVGYYGKIAMTNDGGDTWVYEPTPNAMDDCRFMYISWAGRTPLIGTWEAGIFRYEGDFFKFPPDTAKILAENHDFGTIEIHDTTTTIKNIKIHNQSYADLQIFGFSSLTESAFTNEFVWLDSMTYITVKPNEYFELPVSFKPTEMRKYKDSIIVYSNATKQDSVILLEGEGIDSTIGVRDNFDVMVFEIIPNPASNQVKIKYVNNSVESSNKVGIIKIYNLLGINQNEYYFELIHKDNSLLVDISSLTSGMYYVILNDNGNIQKCLFIKE